MLRERAALSQSRAVEEVLAAMLRQALSLRGPVDRALAAHLRARRHFGSRDRRLIAEAVYAVFRWWGWLRPLVPAALTEALQAEAAAGTPGMAASAPDPSEGAAHVQRAVSTQDWHRLLLAATLLEDAGTEETRAYWARSCGLPETWPASVRSVPDDVERVQRIHRALLPSAPTAVRVEDLIPSWALPEIACPRPLPELIGWLQRRPPLWIRVQHAAPAAVLEELHALDPDACLHDALLNAICVTRTGIGLYEQAAYREGRVEIQDLASQAIGAVCAPSPGQRWWDACAGGGGKSLLLAQRMNDKGTVVASDVRAQALHNLKLRARRARFFNITTREWKGKALPRDKATFDGVLVDAPCTGSGTWRRNPAARWSTDADSIARCAALQRQLLTNAAGAVKVGGVLVYATCSLFRRENEEVMNDFAAAHPSFTREPFPHPLTREPTDGSVQFWPWDGDCDAMFAARWRRQD